MPKRTDIKRVLVIGSGPIVIGQAAEFDYAGTQACLALKEEGYEVVLCNSNPATIMTDTSIADKVDFDRNGYTVCMMLEGEHNTSSGYGAGMEGYGTWGSSTNKEWRYKGKETR